MRIAVCRPQVPFARGGAEIFTDTLVDELRARGHEADIVSVPFKWYPGARVLTQAFLWRMVDLDEVDGSRIDIVIATKFPSYLVRHADKRVWLVHQFRQAYELDGTPLGQFGDTPEDRALRRKVHDLDRVALGEASRLFAISRNVAGRLATLDRPRRRGAVAPAAGARLPLRGLRGLRPLGEPTRSREADRSPYRGGGARAGLRARDRGRGAGPRTARGLAREHGLNGRARFAGRVSEGELADLYASCLAVYYAPVDEDYGMVPLEAFLSEKPVLTTTDAGGPLEVVADACDRARRRPGCR